MLFLNTSLEILPTLRVPHMHGRWRWESALPFPWYNPKNATTFQQHSTEGFFNTYELIETRRRIPSTGPSGEDLLASSQSQAMRRVFCGCFGSDLQMPGIAC